MTSVYSDKVHKSGIYIYGGGHVGTYRHDYWRFEIVRKSEPCYPQQYIAEIREQPFVLPTEFFSGCYVLHSWDMGGFDLDLGYTRTRGITQRDLCHSYYLLV